MKLFLKIKYDEAISKNQSVVVSSIPHCKRKQFFNKLDKKKSVIRWIMECLGNNELGLIDRIRSRLKR